MSRDPIQRVGSATRAHIGIVLPSKKDRERWERLQEAVKGAGPAMPVKVLTSADAILDGLGRRGFERLRERWQDEAAQAAIDGNPQRAHYIERTWIARLGR